jgi:nitroreductase
MKLADKEEANELLVGGKGWINNADKVFLIFGDKLAYKNPAEINFMPFLDAGFVGQNIYMMCETLKIGCCFVNPNIREENKDIFINKYGNDYFCRSSCNR